MTFEEAYATTFTRQARRDEETGRGVDGATFFKKDLEAIWKVGIAESAADDEEATRERVRAALILCDVPTSYRHAIMDAFKLAGHKR